jgi:hypothetical protein
MKTLETLETELQEAHDALLAVTKAGIFGKPRLQACGRVIEAMQAILMRKAYNSGKEDSETEWLNSHRLFKTA